MTTTPLLRVLMNGGVISPADLMRVLDASEAAGNAFVHFSSRQDVLFPASGKGVRAAASVLREAGLPFTPTSLARLHDPLARRNVVSSYAAVNVVDTTWWLTEDVYQYTLANFAEQPRLKVHLVDPAQSLVPLFGGHVHFVASQREQYWHLYLRGSDADEGVERCPGLIHGDDLPRVTRTVESCLLGSRPVPLFEIIDQVQTEATVAEGAPGRDLPPVAPFPYYEGLNAGMNKQHWLGLYWRNNRFDIPFLRAACELCRATKVGKISLTPWKSFIIKGIRSEDRGKWEALTGALGINLRHSSLELNWHIPALDEEALTLKNDLVRELTARDISTYGLTFTVTSAAAVQPFTSVVIEREPRGLGGMETYSIRHVLDFDSSRHEYVTFASGVTREAIPGRLIALTQRYWGRSKTAHESEERPVGGTVAERPHAVGHECGVCMTVYDPEYGDLTADIEPGIGFDALADDYSCSVCGAPRGAYVARVTTPV